MIEELGDDSENWVDIPLRAKIIEQLSFGKLTKILVLEPNVKKEIPVIKTEAEEGLEYED